MDSTASRHLRFLPPERLVPKSEICAERTGGPSSRLREKRTPAQCCLQRTPQFVALTPLVLFRPSKVDAFQIVSKAGSIFSKYRPSLQRRLCPVQCVVVDPLYDLHRSEHVLFQRRGRRFILMEDEFFGVFCILPPTMFPLSLSLQSRAFHSLPIWPVVRRPMLFFLPSSLNYVSVIMGVMLSLGAFGTPTALFYATKWFLDTIDTLRTSLKYRTLGFYCRCAMQCARLWVVFLLFAVSAIVVVEINTEVIF
mmetsp:Transcript_47167/g.142820  ORF Transcript_47167/g.142820 Transcript_47167/m.142820 type:complete len:252 (-) Transcript_47167:1304-2059(-)